MLTPRRIAAAALRRWRWRVLMRIAELGHLPDRLPHGIRAVSFDCFDTLVHRRCDPPSAVFAAWAERVAAAQARAGLEPGDASALAAARIAAEHAAPWRELAAIHRALAPLTGLDPELTRRMELDAERRVLITADGAPAVLAALRGRGLRLAVVSDMYLEPEMLRELLTGLGFDLDGVEVLVSARCRADKRSGGIFPLLCARLDLPAAAILHVGDHPDSDGLMPREHGLHACWLHDRVDLARRARLRRPHLDDLGPLTPAPADLDPVALAIGRDVIGPAFALFVRTALDRIARAAGPGRTQAAAFLARDGWLPLRLAEAALALDPELRERFGSTRLVYLHLSRRSVLPAAGDEPRALLRAFADALGVHGSLRALARLLGLRDEDLAAIDLPGLDTPLATLPDRDARLDALLTLPGMAERIAARRAERIAGLRGYLAQAGILAAGLERLHLVDLGWRSTIQVALGRALRSDPGLPAMTGHLLGNLLAERQLDGLRSTVEPGVLVDAAAPEAADAEVQRAIALLEIACQGGEGSTLGYRMQDGRWQPELGPPPEVDDAFRRAVQAGIHLRLRQVIPALRDGLATVDQLRAEAKAAIARFVRHPTPAEAQAFTRVHFDVDIGTTVRVPCIRSDLGWRDLLPPTRLLHRVRGVAWVEGSLAASRFATGRWLHRAWLAWRRR